MSARKTDSSVVNSHSQVSDSSALTKVVLPSLISQVPPFHAAARRLATFANNVSKFSDPKCRQAALRQALAEMKKKFEASSSLSPRIVARIEAQAKKRFKIKYDRCFNDHLCESYEKLVRANVDPKVNDALRNIRNGEYDSNPNEVERVAHLIIELEGVAERVLLDSMLKECDPALVLRLKAYFEQKANELMIARDPDNELSRRSRSSRRRSPPPRRDNQEENPIMKYFLIPMFKRFVEGQRV